jgi:hypothetical protein
LPSALKAGYKAAISDPQLLSIRDIIAADYALAVGVLQEMSKAKSPPWSEAVRLFGEYKRALRIKDKVRMDGCLAALEETITGGHDAAKTKDRLETRFLDINDRIVHAKTAEHKRMVDMEVLVDVQLFCAFATLVLKAVEEEVRPTAPELFNRANAKIIALLPKPTKENQQHRAPTGKGQSAELERNEGSQGKRTGMVVLRPNIFTLRHIAGQWRQPL